MALEPSDFVLAEKEFDALGHLGDDLVLAGEHLGHIDLGRGHLNAVHIHMVGHLFEGFARGEQRL